jgi:glycosyltransferase involved in cell wall biosynthesis
MVLMAVNPGVMDSMHDIRLLHLFKGFNIGGVEKSTILYSNALAHELPFVGIFARKNVYDHSNLLSDRVTQFFAPFNARLTFFSFLFYAYAIGKIIRKHRITVVNYHQRVYIPVIWCIQLMHPSVKIIYTAHTCFNDPINRLVTADLIIAVSQAVKHDLRTVHSTNIVCLTHGIESHPLSLVHAHHSRIGYIGRFEQTKGILTLLDAMKLLIARNAEYSLLLRGWGPLKDEIVRRVEELGIGSRVSFEEASVTEDGIYSGIDLLVLPSLALEGFGLVLIEAMSRGIPVVGSDMTGINEIIVDGENGRLAPPGNAAELAAVIQSIFEDNSVREKYILNAHASAARKYSLAAYLAQYRALLDDLFTE